MLAIVFNYEDMEKCDALERMGVIYHEVSHTVTHVFAYIGEEETKIGDESRSYLGEHIFKQVFGIYATEEDNRARKRDRETSKQLSKKARRAELQVDLNSNGSARQNRVLESKSIPGGTKDANREDK
jgi:hypothetical protein